MRLRFDEVAGGFLPLGLGVQQVGERRHGRGIAVAHDPQVFFGLPEGDGGNVYQAVAVLHIADCLL